MRHLLWEEFGFVFARVLVSLVTRLRYASCVEVPVFPFFGTMRLLFPPPRMTLKDAVFSSLGAWDHDGRALTSTDLETLSGHAALLYHRHERATDGSLRGRNDAGADLLPCAVQRSRYPVILAASWS